MLILFMHYCEKNMEKKGGRERRKIEKRQDFLQNIFTFGVKLSKSPFSAEIKFIIQEKKWKHS